MEMILITWIVALALGYLIGSIPFGVLVTKFAGAGDIRQVGSGNIGATNVLRTGRKDLAAMTLLGDAGKGVVVVLLARWLGNNDWITAAAAGACFLGHLFPVWLKFHGGKGVATFYGIMLAACWPAGLLAAATWIAVAAIFRLSSLAALVAAALAPIFVLITDQPRPYSYLALFMALLIFVRHHENIRRLLNGEEPRIGKPA